MQNERLSWSTNIGIDPGLGGAVAYITPEGRAGVYDTPTMYAGTKREMSEVACIEILREIVGLHPGPPVLCVLEKVSAMPRQGVSSTFTFGMGYGIWRGILATLKIPYHLVTPQAWKGKMLPGQKAKEAAILQAHRLFPELANSLTHKKHVDRAEAILMAEYGRQHLRR